MRKTDNKKSKKTWVKLCFISVVSSLGLFTLSNPHAFAISPAPVCTDTLPTGWLTSIKAVFTAQSWNTSPSFDWSNNNVPGMFYKPAGQTYLQFTTAFPSSGTTIFPRLGMDNTSVYLFPIASGSVAFSTYDVKLTLPNTWTAIGRTAQTSTYNRSTAIDCYVAMKGYDQTLGGTLDSVPNSFFPFSPGSNWGNANFDTANTAPVLSVTAGDSTVHATWTAPVGHVINYVFRRNGTTVYTGPNNFYEDTGLTNGTTYAYTVRADNTTTGTLSGANSIAPVASGGGGGGGGLTEADLVDGLKTYFTPRVKESMALAITAFLCYIIVIQFRWRYK